MNWVKKISICSAAVAIVAMFGSSAFARAISGLTAPEVDPSMIGGAIALFTGSVMYLTSRRQAK